MIPNKLGDNATAIRDVYAAAEERILRAMAERLKHGKSPSDWQLKKAKELKALRRDMTEIVKRAEKEGRRKRNDLLKQSYTEGWKEFDKELQRAYENGRPRLDIPDARLHALVELQNELSDRFSAVNSEILRDTDDAFRKIIGDAVSVEATGLTTWRQAQQDALNKFAARGITGFIDKAGRRWNIDSYAEMAVRTGMMKAAIQGMKDDALAHDEHLVIITDHEDTCPICERFERMVLALDAEGAKHPDCEGMLADAEAGGLFHPNCLHAATVYVPGLTIREGMKDGKGYTPKMDAEGYSNRQRQRGMERNVRHWKRQQAAAMTPERERECKAHVDQWQRRLREFTEENDLPRKYYREGGRVKLSDKAKKLPPIRFTNVRKSNIIESDKESIFKQLHDSLLSVLRNRLHSKTEGLKKENAIMITDKQFGKKVGKHFTDWGLDVTKESDRETFRRITQDIIKNADEIRAVKWDVDEQEKRTVEILAFIKGEDVVLVRNENVYVTTLKGGANNERIKHGRVIRS